MHAMLGSLRLLHLGQRDRDIPGETLEQITLDEIIPKHPLQKTKSH